MDYAFKPTTHGRAVLAACLDKGVAPEICRVAIGSGKVGEDVNLAEVHELLEYVADGAIVNRRHRDDRFSFTIQYSNVNNPDINTFYLSEFIVYIIDPDTGEETDLLYGTLGDYRQPVPQYHAHIPPSVWNLPLVLVISDELNVTVTVPPGLVTYDELEEAVRMAVDDATADMGNTNAFCAEVLIPNEGWQDASTLTDADEIIGRYGYLDIPIVGVTAGMLPNLTIYPSHIPEAQACGLLAVCKTFDGGVRVYSEKVPINPIKGIILLISTSSAGISSSPGGGGVLPVATSATAGVVMIGENLKADQQGRISVDVDALSEALSASEAETTAVMEDVFKK